MTKTVQFLKNKYAITIILFITWISFFDRNDLMSQYKLRSELNQLRQDKVYFETEIRKNNESMKELQTNPDNLEKFAREKYLMKRENEDIFVFVTPDSTR
jgi:cell division protein FtsB